MLPVSRVDPAKEIIAGGERSLYEVAAAAAGLGLEVELRGTLNGPILDEISAAVGARPRTGLEPRPPEADDVIVVPEGTLDFELLATVRLSPARWVMLLLAPPGLWGWSFRPGWTRCDPLTVPVGSVGTAETFQAISDFGFTLWTDGHGVEQAARAAGVQAHYLGAGYPIPFPNPPTLEDKPFDAAIIEANRWAPLAEQVVARIPELKVLRIPELRSTYALSHALAPARTLVWPSRIEGASRIQREARRAGTIPVALNTNPFATKEDHGAGIVLVDDLDELESELRSLRDDTGRLAHLRAEAIPSAREQGDWPSFVTRVAAALDSLPDPQGASPTFHASLHVLGDELHGIRQRRSAEAEAQLEALRGHIGDLESERRRLTDEVTSSRLERDQIIWDLRDDLAGLASQLETARTEVAAYERRLSMRLIRASRLGVLWVALRQRWSKHSG